MIAGRIEPPQMIFQPKGREGQRIKLRRRAGLKPNFSQTIERMQRRISRHIGIVVPDVASMPDRLIRKNDGKNQNQSANPIRNFRK